MMHNVSWVIGPMEAPGAPAGNRYRDGRVVGELS